MGAKDVVHGKPVTAHIYEYTTQSKCHTHVCYALYILTFFSLYLTLDED